MQRQHLLWTLAITTSWRGLSERRDGIRTGTRSATPSIGFSDGLYKTELIRKRGPWRNVDAVE